MLRLIMRRGPTPGAIYELNTDDITIGRGSKNNIVIRDNDVSREHCRLVRLVDDFEVQDLNSATGTFVNGHRVTHGWVLQPGSILELGEMITLEYQQVVADAPSTPAVAEYTQPIPNHPDEFYASLVIMQGPNAGQAFVLNDLIITIGRDLTNDFVVQDPEVSRIHARLRRWRHGYSIEDASSTNGTFVNEEALQNRRSLHHEDVIRLGTRVQLQYIQNQTRRKTGDQQQWRRGLETNVSKDDTIDLTGWQDETTPNPSRIGTGLQTGALNDHIFVAYAREDWEQYVAPLTLSLQDAGLNVWVDQYLAQGSDDWRIALEQALQECPLMVLVVSDHSKASNYTRLQYRFFLKRQKPVVLLNLDNSKTLTGDLNRMRSILYDPENPRKSFHKLVFEIVQTRRHEEI